MGRRRFGSRMGRRSGAAGTRGAMGAKAGKTLVRQIIICIVIVLFAIAVKKMDHAMTNRALDTVQTFMQKDYSGMAIVDSAKTVFSHLGSLPEAVEMAMADGRRQLAFIEPCNAEALIMTFGGQGNTDGSERSYAGMKYSSEQELQVYASSGGTVIAVEGEEGNQRVRISHGGELETQYAGCTAVYVKPLEKVRKGQLIASVTPGDQSCLTFSMWKGGDAVNPADYIAF